jgi:hypothetical protein
MNQKVLVSKDRALVEEECVPTIKDITEMPSQELQTPNMKTPKL